MGEQTTDKKALNIKQFTIIFFLGLGYTIVYATPFIQYVFYDSLVEALQCTNQQLGYLITIFGIGNLLAPFGGALSDKFNTKKIYIFAMLMICALNVIFTLNMNYSFSLVIWGGFAIFGLFLYFPAHTKLTRLVGSESQQGTILDLQKLFAVLQMLLLTLLLYIYLHIFQINILV